MTAYHRLLACVLLASAVPLVAGCGETPPVGGADSPGRPVPLLELTPVAAEKVGEIIREGQASGVLPKGPLHLRVRVVPGGCCGFLHKLDLDPEVAADDRTFSAAGVGAVVSARQVEMLRGARVDYTSSGKEVGFTVKNPNFEGEALKKWLPVLEAQGKAE